MSQYLCSKCGTIFDKISNYKAEKWNFCPVSGCNGNVIELDDNMVFIIKTLNEKGYITKYCCGGHATDKNNNIYIMFDVDSCKVDFTTLQLPKGFKLELDSDKITIRWDKELRSVGLEKQLLIDEANIKLIDWVIQLGDLREWIG